MSTPQDTLYFAVRRCNYEDREWIDLGSWGYLPQTSETKAATIDKKIPGYAAANPVARIAKFNLVEIG